MTELLRAQRILGMCVGRYDVFAEQQSTGAYLPVRRRIDLEDIERHLRGEHSYGAYVIDPERQTVRFALFDLDTYDADALHFLCTHVERLAGRTSCLMLEESGGKGFHIWLFFDRPVLARDVRAWTQTIADDYAANSYAEDPARRWPALEIFPKQDEVEVGGFGNLVKLPFGVHAKTGNRSHVVEQYALDLADVVPYRGGDVPKAPEKVRRQSAPSHSSDDGPTRLPCMNRVLAEGVGSGQRDDAMYHFAHYLRGCGLEPDEVQLVCERVDELFDPPLGERVIRVKVASAFRAASSHPSCNADWLADYCPGGDECYRSGGTRRGALPAPDATYPLASLPRDERLRRLREGN